MFRLKDRKLFYAALLDLFFISFFAGAGCESRKEARNSPDNAGISKKPEPRAIEPILNPHGLYARVIISKKGLRCSAIPGGHQDGEETKLFTQYFLFDILPNRDSPEPIHYLIGKTPDSGSRMGWIPARYACRWDHRIVDRLIIKSGGESPQLCIFSDFENAVECRKGNKDVTPILTSQAGSRFDFPWPVLERKEAEIESQKVEFHRISLPNPFQAEHNGSPGKSGDPAEECHDKEQPPNEGEKKPTRDEKKAERDAFRKEYIDRLKLVFPMDKSPPPQPMVLPTTGWVCTEDLQGNTILRKEVFISKDELIDLISDLWTIYIIMEEMPSSLEHIWDSALRIRIGSDSFERYRADHPNRKDDIKLRDLVPWGPQSILISYREFITMSHSERIRLIDKIENFYIPNLQRKKDDARRFLWTINPSQYGCIEERDLP